MKKLKLLRVLRITSKGFTKLTNQMLQRGNSSTQDVSPQTVSKHQYSSMELDEIANDHFGSGDAQAQSINDEAELQEQPRADERDDPPDWEKIKGSPLHQSIVSSGMPLSDLEVLQKDRQCLKQDDLSLSEEKSSKQENFKEKESILRKVLVKVQAAVRFLLHLVFPSTWDSMEMEINRMIIWDLVRAKVLDDDDREFLENYLENMPFPTEPEAEQLHSWLTNLFQYRKRRKLCHRREIILSHVRTQLSFLSWMKKCLRLVQETELIARGFTLVSQKSPLSLIEQGNTSRLSSRQCPELRKLLFYTAREAIMVCRERTKNIITNLPLSSELDATGRYLAFQALESYGPCLQTAANQEMELYDLTDGFSVAALKGMVQLCHLHQSEFIKRLILIFDYSCREQKASLISSQLQEEIVRLSNPLQEWSQVLEKSYCFHNSYLLKNQEPKDKVKATGQISPYGDISVAVHSLDLHLQAALTRVRCLSSLLEKLEEEKQSTDTDVLSHDTLTQMMQPIKAEMESCKSCWEEGMNRIDKLHKGKLASPDISSVEKRAAVSPSVGSVKLIPVEEPIIVDQVFEAYTDEDHTEQRDYSWEQPLTAEDKVLLKMSLVTRKPVFGVFDQAKKKREKEEALRLLKELKSVISVRSLEMEKREADALQRYRTLTGTVGDPKDQNLIGIEEAAKDRNLTRTSGASKDSLTDNTGKIMHEGTVLEICRKENSKKTVDLGDCSISHNRHAENISGMEDCSVSKDRSSSKPLSDTNRKVCDINQIDSEVDKLKTKDYVSNAAQYKNNVELLDSGEISPKVDLQLTENSKVTHANDRTSLAENQVLLEYTVNDDFTDSGVIVVRTRSELKESSQVNCAKHNIDKVSDHETADLLKTRSRNLTAKESDSSSIETHNSHTRNELINETSAATVNHDESDEFLNISGETSQESLKVTSLVDKEIQDRTNVVEDGTSSDKSSSYVNISNNSDMDSVYSAMSYENGNITDDISPVKSSANNSSDDNIEMLAVSNETGHNLSSENLEAESNMIENDSQLTLEERLKLIHGENLSFTSNIAALAAAKSRAFGLVEESTYGGETFGDESDEDEDKFVP